MRTLGLAALILLAACGATEQPRQPPSPSSTAQTTASAPSSRTAANRERDYLDALRIAGVPLSKTGQSEIEIGRAVCAQVAEGADPESLADDLKRSVPVWTSDNVTAVIRSALALLC